MRYATIVSHSLPVICIVDAIADAARQPQEQIKGPSPGLQRPERPVLVGKEGAAGGDGQLHGVSLAEFQSGLKPRDLHVTLRHERSPFLMNAIEDLTNDMK